jgi:hypothetical protein
MDEVSTRDNSFEDSDHEEAACTKASYKASLRTDDSIMVKEASANRLFQVMSKTPEENKLHELAPAADFVVGVPLRGSSQNQPSGEDLDDVLAREFAAWDRKHANDDRAGVSVRIPKRDSARKSVGSWTSWRKSSSSDSKPLTELEAQLSTEVAEWDRKERASRRGTDGAAGQMEVCTMAAIGHAVGSIF